jgi:hypothetical protein
MSKETDRMDKKLQQDIIERAANMLRSVAEGKSFNASYFWNVTMAMEAFRDGNPRHCRIHLEAARKLYPSIESYEVTRASCSIRR